jgi:hypothetical protein
LVRPSPADSLTGVMTREDMDALVHGHHRAEEAADIGAIVEGFADDAEHDVAGRPRDQLRGARQIGAYVFDFADGLISRECAWLDVAGLQAQPGGRP